jgi:hypothetical protein
MPLPLDQFEDIAAAYLAAPPAGCRSLIIETSGAFIEK